MARATRPKKKECQRRHAMTRAEQRFGLYLTREELEKAEVLIRESRAEFIHRSSNRVSIWWVELCRERRRVAYDNSSHRICSVLPDEEKEE